MKKIKYFILIILFLVSNLLFADVIIESISIDDVQIIDQISEKTNNQNPKLTIKCYDDNNWKISPNWQYRISTNNATSWSSSINVTSTVSDIGGATEFIEYSTTTLNLPSSLRDNLIEITISNNNSQIAISTYTIAIDTITPFNVIDTTDKSQEATQNKQIKLQWTEPGDEPKLNGELQNITNYKILYSTNSNMSTSTEIANPPTPAGYNNTINFTFNVLLPETTYYVQIFTFDDLQYSQNPKIIEVFSSGIKSPKNFQGIAISSDSIAWSWENASKLELTGYEIKNADLSQTIATLTKETTYFIETGFIENTENTRQIRALNTNWESDFSSATAKTRTTYNYKNSDWDISFSKNDQEFFDNTGSATLKYYTNDDRCFIEKNSKIYVWILDDEYITEAVLTNVSGNVDNYGNLLDDYLYKTKNSSEYDRYFDIKSKVDRHIGTIYGTIYDQNQNPLKDIPVKIITFSKTLNLITDSTGKFSSNLPITQGNSSTIIIEKEGYFPYEDSKMLYNGTNNSSDIVIKKYELNLSADDFHNYPNPFSTSTGTKILFNLQEDSKAEILVYDVKGKMVKKILNENKLKGVYEISWNGSGLAKGIYYMFFKTKNTKKMQKIVIK